MRVYVLAEDPANVKRETKRTLSTRAIPCDFLLNPTKLCSFGQLGFSRHFMHLSLAMMQTLKPPPPALTTSAALLHPHHRLHHHHHHHQPTQSLPPNHNPHLTMLPPHMASHQLALSHNQHAATAAAGVPMTMAMSAHSLLGPAANSHNTPPPLQMLEPPQIPPAHQLAHHQQHQLQPSSLLLPPTNSHNPPIIMGNSIQQQHLPQLQCATSPAVAVPSTSSQDLVGGLGIVEIGVCGGAAVLGTVTSASNSSSLQSHHLSAAEISNSNSASTGPGNSNCNTSNLNLSINTSDQDDPNPEMILALISRNRELEGKSYI